MGSITDFISGLGSAPAGGGSSSSPTTGPIFVPPASTGPVGPAAGAAPIYVPGGTSAPAALAAPKAPSGHGGLGGLLSNAEHIVTGAPLALGNLAAGIGKDTYQGWDRVLHGDFSHFATPGPATMPIVKGYPQTGGRIVDFISSLVPGGEEPWQSQYGKAYSSGNLVGALTQDLGNISLVGGALAKPIGFAADAAEATGTVARAAADEAAKTASAAAEEEAAARAAAQGSASPILNARVLQGTTAAADASSRASALEDAARAAESHGSTLRAIADNAEAASKLVGKGANAPFAPIGWAGKALGATLGGAADLGEEGAAGGLTHPLQTVGNVARGLQGSVASHVEAHGQEVAAKNVMQSGKLRGDELAGTIRDANIARAQEYANPTEAVAGDLLMQGHAQSTAGPYEQLHAYGQPDLANEYVHQLAGELGVEPAALQHAYDSLDSTNQSPEMVASRERMARAEQVYRERALPVLEGEHLKGTDVKGGVPTEAQLSKARQDVHGTEAFGETPEERANPANAPARYRGMLQAGQSANDVLDQMRAEAEAKAPGSGFGLDQLKQDAITTLDRANAEGLNPPHVIGGVAKEGVGFGRRGAELPASRDTGATKFKSGAAQPHTIAAQNDIMVRRAHQIGQNEGARQIQEQLGRTGTDLMGADGKSLVGQRLVDAMQAKGYIPWDPARAVMKDSRLPASQVTATTRFIPDAVARTFRSHFMEYNPDNLSHGFLGTTGRLAVKGSDAINRAFIHSVLHLSPRWIVGHTISRSVLAATAGDLGLELPHYANQARQIIGGHADEAGLTDAERSLLGPHGEAPAGLLRRPQIGGNAPDTFASGPKPEGLANAVKDYAQHPIRGSMRVTSASDDINRVAIALSKADKGLAPDEAAAFIKTHPDLKGLSGQKLVNAYAIRESLRVMGDFSTMSALERDVISRGVLFYPWMKHITGLMAHLAIHDPARVAWTLHLADLYGPKGGLPLTAGHPGIGKNWFANTPSLNPFSSPFSYLGATGSSSTPAASLNPTLQLLGRSLGFNAAKLAPISRPTGFGATTAYGGPLTSWLNPGALEQGALGESPQLAGLAQAVPAALFGHQPVPRYDTGQPIRIGHQDLAPDQQLGGSIGGPFLNLLGVGASKYNLAQIEAQAAAKAKAAAAARKSYSRVLPGRAP